MDYADLNQVSLGSLREREIDENDIFLSHQESLWAYIKLKGFLFSWLFKILIPNLKAYFPDRLQMLITMHRHTDTQTHRHTDTQTHRHTDKHTHTHTHTHTQIHTQTQTHRDTQTHTAQLQNNTNL